MKDIGEKKLQLFCIFVPSNLTTVPKSVSVIQPLGGELTALLLLTLGEPQ